MAKDIEEHSDDGWTKISRGKGKEQPPLYIHGLDPPAKHLTLQHVRANLDAKTKIWQRSTCRKATLAILDKQEPDQGWQLTKAVCLGSNSFSRDNWQARQRSVTQLAAFLDIIRHLQAKQRSPIALYAQEPQYTPLDSELLESLDVHVLDAIPKGSTDQSLGEAAHHISGSTFVFEAFMDLNTQALEILLNGDPPLYIGSSMEKWTKHESRMAARPGAHLRSVVGKPDHSLRKCGPAEIAAQFEEDPNVLEGLSIYWKEPVDDDGDGT
ncbi:hypothetical protein LTR53_011883 [Teratosphaeriaceae sp. CCFEE 6253]|nr:hypothetical protein LTR53_011883 [Teratosphaeriaceae sp. CCFEE 6253]